MSIADKLTTIAENEKRVYDSGFKNGQDDRDLKTWQMFTANGTRGNAHNGYMCAFIRQDWSGYTFAKPIAPKGSTPSCERMFYEYLGTKLPKNIDLSGLAPSANVNDMFTWSTKITEIYDIGLPAMNTYYYTFANCYRLEKIMALRVHEGTTFTNTFNRTDALKDITIEGTIGNNINFSYCTLLTHDSLMSAINCLKDYSGDTSSTAYTLTLGSTNLAKLTAEEQQIVIDKGWTLA